MVPTGPQIPEGQKWILLLNVCFTLLTYGLCFHSAAADIYHLPSHKHETVCITATHVLNISIFRALNITCAPDIHPPLPATTDVFTVFRKFCFSQIIVQKEPSSVSPFHTGFFHSVICI